MDYLFNLRLFDGLTGKLVFTDLLVKWLFTGYQSLLPVVEYQGRMTCWADSVDGGLPGLAVERLEAVTIGISRCTGPLPYSDATLYSPTLLA